MNIYKQGISYIGVDNNVYWRKIHNFIKENFKGGGVKFKRNIDVLTYFEKYELHKCNVIIIQYLISFDFFHKQRKCIPSSMDTVHIINDYQ